MRAGADLIGFLRGTRPLAPPGPKRPAAAVVLFTASFAHLPLVYALVRDGDLPPPFALAVGMVAMGLAWAGGVSLEGRRRGTAQIFAGAAVAEAALAFVPGVAGSIGALGWLFVGIGALGAAALFTLRDKA